MIIRLSNKRQKCNLSDVVFPQNSIFLYANQWTVAIWKCMTLDDPETPYTGAASLLGAFDMTDLQKSYLYL